MTDMSILVGLLIGFVLVALLLFLYRGGKLSSIKVSLLKGLLAIVATLDTKPQEPQHVASRNGRPDEPPKPSAPWCPVILTDRGGRDAHLGTPVKRILAAKHEVWLSGTTLNVGASGDWRGFERTAARVKVLLPDFTREDVVTITAACDNRDRDRQRRMIEDSSTFFRSVKTGAGPVEVRLLPYSPCYSVFAVDANGADEHGYISVELIGYHYRPSETPNFTLCKIQNEQREAYQFFLDAWEHMWDAARPLGPDHSETGPADAHTAHG